VTTMETSGMLQRTEALVRALAARMDPGGRHREDLVQEGRVAVMLACRGTGRECVSFFARRAEWAMRDYMRRSAKDGPAIEEPDEEAGSEAQGLVVEEMEAALTRVALAQLAERAGLTPGERWALGRLLAGGPATRSQQTVLCRVKSKLKRALQL